MQDVCIMNWMWQNLGNCTASYQKDVRDDLAEKNNFLNNFFHSYKIATWKSCYKWNIGITSERRTRNIQKQIWKEKYFHHIPEALFCYHETRQKSALKLLTLNYCTWKGNITLTLISFHKQDFFLRTKLKTQSKSRQGKHFNIVKQTKKLPFEFQNWYDCVLFCHWL